MILVTGATGQVGSALVRRLVARRTPVRCLVRDPRRLGPERVRVQIALGDLADPPSFRNALRGVEAVVHLGATFRDQQQGSIEELNAIATWRMVEAARRARVGRFVFFSALGASVHHRTRVHRAKALAERIVLESDLDATVFAPSLMYSPGDLWLKLLQRASVLPAVPVSGLGRARSQPLWAEDAADCVLAALDDGAPRRLELAGPETLSQLDVVRLVQRSYGNRPAVVPVPAPLVRGSLRLLEATLKSKAPATWDEAELLEVDMTSPAGTRDAELLGVTPRRMADVLGSST